MKKTSFLTLAILSSMVFLSGCMRYTTICELQPSDSQSAKMTLKEASSFIKDSVEHVPAGRRPFHRGDRVIGKYTTSVRLRKHNRTGLVLVEVYDGSRITMEFYVHSREDGEKFAAAVWRLRQEYLDK